MRSAKQALFTIFFFLRSPRDSQGSIGTFSMVVREPLSIETVYMEWELQLTPMEPQAHHPPPLPS